MSDITAKPVYQCKSLEHGTFLLGLPDDIKKQLLDTYHIQVTTWKYGWDDKYSFVRKTQEALKAGFDFSQATNIELVREVDIDLFVKFKNQYSMRNLIKLSYKAWYDDWHRNIPMVVPFTRHGFTHQQAARELFNVACADKETSFSFLKHIIEECDKHTSSTDNKEEQDAYKVALALRELVMVQVNAMIDGVSTPLALSVCEDRELFFLGFAKAFPDGFERVSDIPENIAQRCIAIISADDEPLPKKVGPLNMFIQKSIKNATEIATLNRYSIIAKYYRFTDEEWATMCDMEFLSQLKKSARENLFENVYTICSGNPAATLYALNRNNIA